MQIFVLGMHRSGTSALTRVLGFLGVHVGSPSEMNAADAANPRGYWERREVLALDEEILAALEASWCEPLPADPARLQDPERSVFEKRAAAIVASLDRDRPWAVKDPRLCLLFPLWRKLLADPLCVLVHRDPLEVARSMKTRDGFPLPLGLALWEAYARAALSSSEGLPRLIVPYASLVEDPVGTATRLAAKLAALGIPISGSVPEGALREFISPALRRERSEPGEKRELMTPVQIELLRLFEAPELPVTVDPGPLSRGARELLEAHAAQSRTDRLLEASVREEAAARAGDVRRFNGIVADRDALIASLGGRPTPSTKAPDPSPAGTAPAGRTELAVCTIVAKNYLAMARTLCRSFLDQHPGARAFVLLADEVEGSFDPSLEPFELVEARALEVPDFADLAYRYSVLELATSLKPAFLLHLLEKRGVENLVYLDPDIFVYGPLEEVRQSLEGHDVVLTPHILEPIRPDGRMPEERDLLSAGVFNLGFVAVRRSPAALSFLDWWGARLHDGAYLDFEKGLFTDQKWMNLAPCFLDRLEILRHRGYNVAYWNLQERLPLAPSGDGWSVDGEPLRFIHFSGLNPDQPNLVSKHQNRFRLSDLGRAYRELVGAYLHALEAAGLEQTRRLAYRYSAFDDGTVIPERARRLFRDLGESRRRFGDPFRTGAGSFLEWLRAPRQPESPVTNLADHLYRQRPDVMRAFPDPDDVHALAFHDWLVARSGDELGLEEAWVDAFRQTRERLEARDAGRRRDAEREAAEAARREAQARAEAEARRAEAEAEAEARRAEAEAKADALRAQAEAEAEARRAAAAAEAEAERAAAEKAALAEAARARAEAERAAAEKAALEAEAREKVEAERAAAAMAATEAAARAKAEAEREAAHLIAATAAATAAAVAEEARRERSAAEVSDAPKSDWKWWGRILLGPDRYRLLRDRRWRRPAKR